MKELYFVHKKKSAYITSFKISDKISVMFGENSSQLRRLLEKGFPETDHGVLLFDAYVVLVEAEIMKYKKQKCKLILTTSA